MHFFFFKNFEKLASVNALFFLLMSLFNGASVFAAKIRQRQPQQQQQDFASDDVSSGGSAGNGMIRISEAQIDPWNDGVSELTEGPRHFKKRKLPAPTFSTEDPSEQDSKEQIITTKRIVKVKKVVPSSRTFVDFLREKEKEAGLPPGRAHNKAKASASMADSTRDQICNQPSMAGLAYVIANLKVVPRWYFKPSLNKCLEFKNGGCWANVNCFITESQCMTFCTGVPLKNDSDRYYSN